jgi:hypothetical protein
VIATLRSAFELCRKVCCHSVGILKWRKPQRLTRRGFVLVSTFKYSIVLARNSITRGQQWIFLSLKAQPSDTADAKGDTSAASVWSLAPDEIAALDIEMLAKQLRIVGRTPKTTN